MLDWLRDMPFRRFLRQLASSNVRVGTRAARALGTQKDARAVPALIEVAVKDGSRTGDAAVDAIVAIGPAATGALTAELRRPHDYVAKQKLIAAIDRIGDRRAGTALEATMACRREDECVRRRAAEALARLQLALHDPGHAAIQAVLLKRVDDRMADLGAAAVPGLLTLMSEPSFRDDLLAAIRKIGAPAAEPLAMQLECEIEAHHAHHANSDFPDDLVDIIGELASSVAAPPLARVLTRKDIYYQTRKRVLGALLRSDPQSAIEPLVALAERHVGARQEDDPSELLLALGGLCEVPDARASDVICRFLADARTVVRVWSAKHLVSRGDERGMSYLLANPDNPDALQIIGESADARVIPILLEQMARDRGELIGEQASTLETVLERCGGSAAREDLEACLQTGDREFMSLADPDNPRERDHVEKVSMAPIRQLAEQELERRRAVSTNWQRPDVAVS
jgi:HEAT repeat protein